MNRRDAIKSSLLSMVGIGAAATVIKASEQLGVAVPIEIQKEMLDRLRIQQANYAKPGMVFRTNQRLSDPEIRQQVEEIWRQHRLAEQFGEPKILHNGAAFTPNGA